MNGHDSRFSKINGLDCNDCSDCMMPWLQAIMVVGVLMS